jgi:hypothetical protein
LFVERLTQARARLAVASVLAMVLALAAIGQTSGAPRSPQRSPIKFDPPRLNFGQQPFGSTTIRTVVLTNASDQPVNMFVGLIPHSDLGTVGFSRAQPYPTVDPEACFPWLLGFPPSEGVNLEPGESCNWYLTFAPNVGDGVKRYSHSFAYVLLPDWFTPYYYDVEGQAK